MKERKDITINKNEIKEKKEKKRTGFIIGTLGFAAAAAIAVPLGLKGCSPKGYTVTFLTDDEVRNFEEKSMNVKDGTRVGDLKKELAPLDGYKFKGFFKDEACQDPFNDDDIVTKDTKIYIQYEEIEATIIFYSDSSMTDVIETVSVKFYSKFTNTFTPTKSDDDYARYTFRGWQTVIKDETGHFLTNDDLNNLSGEQLIALDADGDGTLELYAEYDTEAGYSIVVPDGLTVRRGSQILTSSNKVFEGDKLTINQDENSDWIINGFEVSGVNRDDSGIYTVTGNVKIEVTDVDHRYLIFTLSGDEYQVKGMKTEATETHIKIPAYHYNGKAITSIYSSAFKNNTAIAIVDIGENVKTISTSAFNGCTGLEKICIGERVTSIGTNAFENCNNLIEVDFLGTIDQWVSISFSNSISNPTQYSHSLKIKGELISQTTINVNVKKYAFFNVENIKNVVLSDSVTNIDSYAFYKFIGLQEIIISKTITSIGYDSFNNCISLTNVTILGKITKIDGYSFAGCTSLVTVDNIIENLTAISSNAFQNCTSLKYLNTGDTVTSISYDAFNGCSGLKEVVLGESMITVGRDAFRECSSLEKLTIGSNVTTLGYVTFYGCTKLSEVDFLGTVDQWASMNFPIEYTNPTCYSKSLKIQGKELTSATINAENISDYAFHNLTKLTKITLGENVKTIGRSAFEGCSKLTEVDFLGELEQWVSINFEYNAYSNPTYYSKSLNIKGKKLAGEISLNVPISAYAFRNITSLTKVTLGEKVTSIETATFRGCSGLQEIILGKNIESIGNYAFDSCSSLFNVTILGRITELGSYAFQNCSSLTNIDNIIENLISIPDYAFYGCSGIQKIIAENITSIGNYAFYGCSSLTSIDNLIKNLTNIPDRVFYGCSSLKEITIPEQIESIGSYAFNSCSGITSITILGKITSLGSYAFQRCSSLTNIDNIIENLTNIPYAAFYDCSGLTSIVIPKSISSIGITAFYNCNNLTTVYYGGTEEDWKLVSVGSSNTPLTSAKMYYYIDENPFEGDGAVTDGNYWHFDEVTGEPKVWTKEEIKED